MDLKDTGALHVEAMTSADRLSVAIQGLGWSIFELTWWLALEIERNSHAIGNGIYFCSADNVTPRRDQ